MDNRLEALVKDVVFTTVRKHYPGSIDVLQGLFAGWRSGADVASHRHVTASEIAASGGPDDHRAARFVFAMTLAFAESVRLDSELPRESEIREALIGCAKGFGLRGPAPKKLADAILPQLTASIAALRASCSDAVPNRTAPFAYLTTVETSTLTKKQTPLDAAPNLCELRARYTLVVDEISGQCIGPKKAREISELTERQRVALWCVLRWYGDEFELSQICALRGQETSADGLRKYPTEGRALLLSLTGQEVFPRARKGMYAVRATDWTWAWIRRSADIHQSRLLSMT